MQQSITWSSRALPSAAKRGNADQIELGAERSTALPGVAEPSEAKPGEA